MRLDNCPNCKREFFPSVKDQYCPECWSAWCRNDGSFEKMTDKEKGLPLTKEAMLEHLSKQTGGIPDFAKKALKDMGLDDRTIDKADKAGKQK